MDFVEEGQTDQKETRRSAVYRTPWAIFQLRSITWRSGSKKDKERHVEGQKEHQTWERTSQHSEGQQAFPITKIGSMTW